MAEARTYSGEPNPRTMLVQGPLGAGKTSFGIETLAAWLESGVPPEQVLVLVPQRTLAGPYLDALSRAEAGPMGSVEVRTLSGLAQDNAVLYWPLIAEEAGFSRPELPPHLLTIETAQYAMAGLVGEAVERGEFEAISVSPQQIARQVLDTLNKAALMGIDYRQVPHLLTAAWGPDRPRRRALAYQAAGRVAAAFRQYCLENRLLDYSLQIQLFRSLLADEPFRERFFASRTHLIAEHIEEDTAFAHDLLREWLPHLQGALLTYEWDAGYRVFLGADPDGAEALASAVEGVITLPGSHVTGEGTAALLGAIGEAFRRDTPDATSPDSETPAFTYAFHSYYPQMIDWVAGQIAELVHGQGVAPGEIAVVAPFLSDALRFSLGQKLDAYGIPHVSHRPSRALRDEPAARCVLTLAALANPGWELHPPRPDVAQALQLAIAGLDPVRADLLARVVYHPKRDGELLGAFEGIKGDMQARITYLAGQRYDALRGWLLEAAAGHDAPLDHLFSRLFGEVLSQPGFGFHDDPEAGRVIAELVESAYKFREALFRDEAGSAEAGRRYYQIVTQGLLSAQYVGSWRDARTDAVFLAPAYTFLLRNRAVDVQFWLDVGATGWWERLDQPLTHPYVLSPGWEPGTLWTDAEEYAHQQDMLYRIMSGLVRRCRRTVYLGISDLGEQGYEQRGPMLRVFQQILRRHGSLSEVADA